MAVPGRKADDKLASSILLGSEDDERIICQPCITEGRTLPAFGFCIDCDEHLCQSCFKGHKKSKPCRDHKLLDKDAMPKSQKLFTASQSDDVSTSLSTKCEKHSEELMKYHCRDHKVVLCGVCAMLEHRNCRIDYVPDISTDIVDSKKYTDVMGNIDVLLHKCQAVKADTKRDVGLSDTSLEDALKVLVKVRKDMNETMDKLEQNIRNKVQLIRQENANTLQKSVQACDEIQKAVESRQDNIKQLNATKQSAKLFVELSVTETVINNHRGNIDKLEQKQNVKEYNFLANPNLCNIFADEKLLGKLSEKPQWAESRLTTSREDDRKQKSAETEELSTESPKTSKHTNSETKTLKGFQLSHVGDIRPHTSSDKKDIRVIGMAVTPECLLLADSNNWTLKMVDLISKAVTSEIALFSEPWDATLTAFNELVVALPLENRLQFVAVTDKLSVTNSIKVSGDCYGVTSSQDKFAVTYKTNARLEIIDMKKGSVVTTVKTRRNGEVIFQYPEYATSTSAAIFISDWGQKAVIQLNWQGHVLGKFSVADKPQGITSTTEEGTIYVCQFMTGNVVAISNGCKHGAIVQSKLGGLGGATFCNRNQLLFVRTGYGESTCIKVFKCM